MRIQLVQPDFNAGKRLPETPSRALLILGTLAKQRGHEVRIAHLDIDEIEWSWKPEIVGITVNTFQVKAARALVKTANQHGTKIIIGGPHAAAWNKNQDGKVDEVVIGEGENAWLKFIGAEPCINDIDDIPRPDYTLVDMERFTGIEPVGAMPSGAIMASRGCPYQCSFCNTPTFWGKKVRYRKPEEVVSEVQHLHDQYGINEIFFQDDTFNINHEWAFAIFNELIALGLNEEMMFKIDCRVNEKLLTQDFLDLARKAGVWNIFFGIESGSQYMLDRMRKGITVREIKRAVEMTKAVGIKAQCSFVVGLPGESLKTLQETDELIRTIKPSWYGWCYFCPFPNTEAANEAKAKGWLNGTDYGDYCYGNVYARTEMLTVPELQAFRGFSYH